MENILFFLSCREIGLPRILKVSCVKEKEISVERLREQQSWMKTIFLRRRRRRRSININALVVCCSLSSLPRKQDIRQLGTKKIRQLETHKPKCLVTHKQGSLATHNPGSLVTHYPGSLVTHNPGSLVTNNPGSLVT